MVTILRYFPPELDCEDYSCLDQAVEGFEESDTITSSVSLGFIQLVSTLLINLNYSLFLASSLIN